MAQNSLAVQRPAKSGDQTREQDGTKMMRGALLFAAGIKTGLQASTRNPFMISPAGYSTVRTFMVLVLPCVPSISPKVSMIWSP